MNKTRIKICDEMREAEKKTQIWISLLLLFLQSY